MQSHENILITSIALNIVLLSMVLLNNSRDNAKIQREEVAKFKLRNAMNSTVRYTTNLVQKIEKLSEVADNSTSAVRSAYDKSSDGRISRQLALDSVYLVKEWIDKAKVESKKWPENHQKEVDAALAIE